MASNDIRVSRPLPQAATDTTVVTARGNRYGEPVLAMTAPTRHGLAEEGSYLLATNPTPGTAFAYSITTAFTDTIPAIYIFNKESASSGTGKSIFLDYLKLIVSTVPASTTQAHFAIILDNVNRALSVDNTTVVTPVCPNPSFSPSVSPTIKMQNNGTASTIAASSANKVVAARGSLGGLPVIGDELLVAFGVTDVGSGRTTTSTGRQSSHAAPVIIPPQWSATVHLWFVSNAATGLSYEAELGMWAR